MTSTLRPTLALCLSLLKEQLLIHLRLVELQEAATLTTLGLLNSQHLLLRNQELLQAARPLRAS